MATFSSWLDVLPSVVTFSEETTVLLGEEASIVATHPLRSWINAGRGQRCQWSGRCGISLREKNYVVVWSWVIGCNRHRGDGGVILKRNRLRWFGHVERKEKMDWVRKCSIWRWMLQGQERPDYKWLRMIWRVWPSKCRCSEKKDCGGFVLTQV